LAPTPISSSQSTVSSPHWQPPPVRDALLQLHMLQPHAFQSRTDSTLPNAAHTSRHSDSTYFNLTRRTFLPNCRCILYFSKVIELLLLKYSRSIR
jgi:hypothetical protein